MPRFLALVLVMPLLVTGCCKTRPPEKPKPCDCGHKLTATDVKGRLLETYLITEEGKYKSCPPDAIETGKTYQKLEVVYNASGDKYWAIVGPESKYALLSDKSLYLCYGWVYVWHVTKEMTRSPAPSTS